MPTVCPVSSASGAAAHYATASIIFCTTLIGKRNQMRNRMLCLFVFKIFIVPQWSRASSLNQLVKATWKLWSWEYGTEAAFMALTSVETLSFSLSLFLSLTLSTNYFLGIISAKWSVIICCICVLKVRHHIVGKLIIRQELGDAVQAHLTAVAQIPHETAAC